jgi:hypothetical protein
MKMDFPKDIKCWYAISCPTAGLRFDSRTLEFLDSDCDGRIRSDEVAAALKLLEESGVSREELFSPVADLDGKIAENAARQADLAKEEPSEEEKAALAKWEEEGRSAEVAVLGEATAEAEKALSAVEGVIDSFFAPPEDMPLVTDAPDVELPLSGRINPKYSDEIEKFALLCVKPLLGDVPQVSRTGWKKIKASFAAYRSWAASKPETSAAAKAALVEEEKILRYRRYLGEFLENYVTMKHLYDDGKLAMFQMGVLRIDGKEMNLCFHVENEASHSALSGKSKCCVLYLKLTRPSEGVVRSICAVVTAGTIGGLYVGRNGVFYDYDGKDWDAVVTKVVEAQVSLLEAFWSPWRKLGESIASTVKKFLGDKQAAADAKLSSSVEKAASAKSSDSAASASLASSIAAIGIGVGFIGAAAASLMASLSRLSPWQIGGSIVALILVVSLPSMLLAYFNLRKRDLGAILNAGGWAINRPMKLSMKKSRDFTKCAKNKGLFALFAVFALIIALLVAGSQFFSERKSSVQCPQESAQCAAPEASDSISK